MEEWESFMRTGGIEEYLIYRCQEKKRAGEENKCQTSERKE